jgi:hypothetical protein
MPTTTIKIDVKKQGNFTFRDKTAKVELSTTAGMRQMIEDIHRTSRPITPMLSGDLRSDVIKTVKRIGSIIRGTIEWHRPYSWYQERGYTNGPVRRYTTPGTRAHFAETSVKEVTSSPKKYFGKKI